LFLGVLETTEAWALGKLNVKKFDLEIRRSANGSDEVSISLIC
jgi:hypothetical protein